MIFPIVIVYKYHIFLLIKIQSGFNKSNINGYQDLSLTSLSAGSIVTSSLLTVQSVRPIEPAVVENGIKAGDQSIIPVDVNSVRASVYRGKYFINNSCLIKINGLDKSLFK